MVGGGDTTIKTPTLDRMIAHDMSYLKNDSLCHFAADPERFLMIWLDLATEEKLKKWKTTFR